jgi:hypothetical protein
MVEVWWREGEHWLRTWLWDDGRWGRAPLGAGSRGTWSDYETPIVVEALDRDVARSRPGPWREATVELRYEDGSALRLHYQDGCRVQTVSDRATTGAVMAFIDVVEG